MFTKIWTEIKWLLNFMLEWRVRSYPIAKIGQGIIWVSIAPWCSTAIAIKFELSPNSYINKFSFTLGNSSLILEFISIALFLFGGLARVPFLVAYGACFRATSAKVRYFDRFHGNSDWQLLNEQDKPVLFSEYDLNDLQATSDGDVGLAVGFTTPIHENQLPEYVRSNTIILKPNIQKERNLIANQDNLHQISEEIQQIIDKLSALNGCYRVHLFLSVQSTLALDIGKRYQEGIHKNWIIHNFNGNMEKYDWGIELSKTGIEEYNDKS